MKFYNSLLNKKDFVELVRKTVINIKQQYTIPEHEDNISDNVADKNDQLFLEVLLIERKGQSTSFSSHIKKIKKQ